MNETELRRILTEQILPMFPGSSLLRSTLQINRRVDHASFADPCNVALWLGAPHDFRILLNRSQAFSFSDVVFLHQFMLVISRIAKFRNESFFPRLVAASVPDAIAGCVSIGTTTRSHTFRILQQLESWASQTYEGQPITCSIGVDPTVGAEDGPDIREIWKHDFSAVITSGLDTVLVVTKKLQVSSFEPLDLPTDQAIAPYRLLQMAGWSDDQRILFALNRNGEILVFKDKSLLFAKRRGRWVHFSHDTISKRFGRVGSVDLRQAVYETCLDVSFARTGGCIAVVKSSAHSQLEELVHPNDLNELRKTTKSSFIAHISRKPFVAIDRRLRQEIVAIDGATILDHRGHILAAGAIVKVPSGSHAGARRASAIALSNLGFAVKISHDGGITSFKGNGSPAPEVTFEIG